MYRQITAQTTDGVISQPVTLARQALVTFASESVEGLGMTGETLVEKAQAVMNAEAVAMAAYGYRNVLSNTSDPSKAMEYLMSLLTKGADDTWSGRGNEARRSAHDQVVAFVRKMADNLRYGN
jgi:hypothetical protein